MLQHWAWWLTKVSTLIFNNFNEGFLRDSSHLEGEKLEGVNLLMSKNVRIKEPGGNNSLIKQAKRFIK